MNNFNKILFAFWLYIISDCIIFSILFISFLSSHNFFFKNLFFNYKTILIETILLLFCSFLSIKVINNFNKKYYYLNLIFSILFLLIEFKDIFHLNFINLNYKINNFMSNYFIIIFFHAFHVFTSIIFCLNLIFLNFLKKKIKINNIIFSIYWHFIHIIWICLILTIYIKN